MWDSSDFIQLQIVPKTFSSSYLEFNQNKTKIINSYFINNNFELKLEKYISNQEIKNMISMTNILSKLLKCEEKKPGKNENWIILENKIIQFDF